MLMLNRIMLASDSLASAITALRYAAPLARLSHASLHLLHVVDTRVLALPRWSELFRATIPFAAQEAATREVAQRLRSHAALAGLQVEESIRHGHPGDSIVDAAAVVDLVVLGISGPLSSLSENNSKMVREIVHRSPVPVMVVPSGENETLAELTADASLPIHNILLAIQVSSYAPQALTLAQDLTGLCKASLLAVQVFESDKLHSYPFVVDGGLTHNLDAARVLLQSRLEALVGDVPGAPPVRHRLCEGQPAAEILQQASTHQASLMIMSVHAYEGLQKLFMPSTVDAVLEQLPCPLLTVPFPPVH